jgi:arylsulfatase A-like enzyme
MAATPTLHHFAFKVNETGHRIPKVETCRRVVLNPAVNFLRAFKLFALVSTMLPVVSSAGETAAAAASAGSPPNILFAIADDWGVHAAAYGSKWVRTPAFDRVARDGILFRNAYTPNAKCAPSRASILTGRNSWQLKAAANHICYFPPEFKGWGEALGDHGWFVGHTQKGWAPGVATNAMGRPRQMTGKAFNARKAKPPTPQISNNDYAANFEEFLEAAPGDKPWCFWYGAVEPHRGYEFGSGVAKGGKKLTDIDHVPGYWPDNNTVRNDMLDYAFEVEHFDRHLGRMLQSLETRKELDNTLVIVTSDHGMPFPRVKGNAYEFANHVPLAAMWKRGILKTGRVVDDFVSFIDLAPTFIELAGLKWSDTGMAESPGRSLTGIFRSEKGGQVNPARDHVLIGKERTDIGRPHDWGYPIRGIVKNGWVYLRNFEPDRWPAGNPETGYLDCDGGATKTFILDAHRKEPSDKCWGFCFGIRPAEELYDLRADPDCLRNAAHSPDTGSVHAGLTNALFRELTLQGDPRMAGQGEVFDHYPYANPGQVGFHERFIRGEKVDAGWVSKTDFEPISPGRKNEER